MRVLNNLQRWGVRRLGKERCRRIIRQLARLSEIDMLNFVHRKWAS